MDGWMDGCDRPSEIDRPNDALRPSDATRTIDGRTIDLGRGTGAGRTPTRARRRRVVFTFTTDGRTDGRTARERFENVILSDRSKPFARVGIYIRLMYGTVCMHHAHCCDAFISTLKNPKP